MWALYALIAAGLTSFLPIINKRLLADTDVALVAWGFNALSLPILGAAVYLLTPAPQVDAIFWLGIVGSGILNMLATLISTQALKFGDASLVTPFLTFNPIFTLLIALFTLGETPNPGGVIGVAIIAMGAYLFAGEEAKAGALAPLQALFRQSGVRLAILASFIWGLTPIFEKIAIQHSSPQNPPLVALLTTLVMALSLLVGIVARRQKIIPALTRHKLGFFSAAVIAGIAPLFGFTAIAAGLVGYVTALFKLSPVFTVIFAHLLLGEGRWSERLLGSSVMVVGALVLALETGSL